MIGCQKVYWNNSDYVYLHVTCNLSHWCSSVDRLTSGTRVKPNQEEVFLLWKKEKDKLLRERKLKEKIQKETVKPDNDKNAAADIVGDILLKLMYPK